MVVGLAGLSAHAATVDIGGGWSASWPDSLNPYVEIVPLGVEENADGGYVFIRKEAIFIQGPQLGVFPSIPITFQQTQVDAYEFIVIEEEIIENQTGVPWSDFHMLLEEVGDAAFDPVRTAASGGPATLGFDVSPFTSHSFTPINTLLNLEGGEVANGATWTPGAGLDGGALFIDVVPNSEPDSLTTFTLKETPTPEPAAVTLMLLGGAAVLARRSR